MSGQSKPNYSLLDTTISISDQSIPITRRVDVLVCGGGVAGLAAAVAAARCGAKTLLIERAGYLGGTATGSSMALIVIPAKELVGFPKEFFARLATEHGAGLGDVVPWDVEAYKLVALETLVEAGAGLLLYTLATAPLLDANGMNGVVVENKSGRQAILAKVVIDATGDGDIAMRAGVPFVMGREADGAMRPVTVMGRIGNIDLRAFKAYIDANPGDFSQDDGRRVVDLANGVIRIDGFFSIVEKAKKLGYLSPDMPVNYLRFSGVAPADQLDCANLVCNSTRVYGVDGTNADDITRAEIAGRQQLRAVVRLCRDLLPGFERSYLVDTSGYLGVRETRRIKGQFIFTYDHIAKGTRFDDSIAVMTALDRGTTEIHSPDYGHEGSEQDDWARRLVFPLMRFEFPLRCLLPEGIANLLVAGRCCSVTHDVDKFTRGMSQAALMGQGAGTYAALTTSHGAGWGKLPIAELQAELARQGVPTKLGQCPVPSTTP